MVIKFKHIKYLVILLISFSQLTTNAKLPNQLQNYFIYPPQIQNKINEKFFIALLETLEQNKLKVKTNQEIIRKISPIKLENQNRLKKILKELSIDNLVVTTFSEPEKGLYDLTLTIYDQNMNVKVKKVSQNILSIKKNIKLLKTWVNQHVSDSPPIGQLISLKNNEAQIIFSEQKNTSFLEGKHFQVYCIVKECKNINNLSINGIFYKSRKKKILGHIYSNNHLLKKEETFLKNYYIVPLKRNYTKMDKAIKISEKNIENSTFYTNSLLACTILPITGNTTFANKLKQDLIYRIKKDARCQYKKNSYLNGILNKFKYNLKDYFNNPQVLKAIAKTTKTGSIVKINISKQKMGTIVSYKVIGQNGDDIYFSRSKILVSVHYSLLQELLYHWTLKYIASLPLDATIVESVGPNIMFNIGYIGLKENKQHYDILRPVKLNLFTKGDIYTSKWTTKTIASGAIKEIRADYSIGYILLKSNIDIVLKEGDWIKFRGYDKLKDLKPIFVKHNIKNQRKTWRINGAFDISKFGSTKNGNVDTTENSLFLSINTYLPYGGLLRVESEKSFKNFSDFSLEKNNFKGALGYSFLLSGIQLISLMDVYIGYQFSFTEATKLEIFGIGDLIFKSPYLALQFEIPLYKKNKAIIGLNISPSATMTNSSNFLGNAKSASYFGGYLSVDHKIKRRLSLFGEVLLDKYKATMEVGDAVINITKTKFRIGLRLDI